VRAQTEPAQQRQAVDEYLSLLGEHIGHWPAGATADTTRSWLGRLYQQQRLWPKALEAYQAVSPRYPDQHELLLHVALCYDAQLAASPEGEMDAQLQRARQWFDNRARSLREANAGRWNDEARQAAGLAARFRLLYPPTDYVAAEALLHEARSDSEQRSGREAVSALLVVALAGREKYEEALVCAQHLSSHEPAALVEVLRGLRIVSDLDPRPSGKLAPLQLHVARLLEPHRVQITAAGLYELRSATADACGATSRRDEALDIYRQLAADHPDNARVQRRYAEVLLDGADTASHVAALRQWRVVMRRTPPRTLDWLRAKYGVALAHYKLGHSELAREVLLATQRLDPDLGGEPMRQQFRQLLELCGQ
jgi:tetratricopeptide (TPR) repeat protein